MGKRDYLIGAVHFPMLLQLNLKWWVRFHQKEYDEGGEKM